MNNLIGLSGKIGSGKDTLCDIINYLSQEEDWDSFEHFMEESSTHHDKYNNKKFAGKLKTITAMLIGCTRTELEDRDFKNKELGEEWWYYKDRINDHIYDYDNMKDAGAITHHTLELIKPTPRLLLQLLGTEAGRQIIHPNIWVNALFADYKVSKRDFKDGNYIGGSCVDCGKLIGFGCAKRQPWCLNCSKKEDKPNWIITDVRFPNEVEAIENRGGIVIRIERTPRSYGTEFIIDEHPSETALDDHNFDYVIDNDGSISDLIDKVRKLKLKIQNYAY